MWAVGELHIFGMIFGMILVEPLFPTSLFFFKRHSDLHLLCGSVGVLGGSFLLALVESSNIRNFFYLSYLGDLSTNYSVGT